ncbi:ATP-binding cassette domain-containing protein [Alkalilacustris brevis]|uniref:ATP-binding cassette domain-containing protein n=1 Tax=Alkalilacustris brevis TaxID=2026338 RepID=UPI000E0CD211|nr:ATP-binding cassette domain-containing protein [Alkalilacustris brevis]
MVATVLPLTLEEVTLHRNGRCILGPVSLEIPGGGITVVMGPNGSGKTSLLRAMHGLERINAGQVRWSGETERVRASQAFVFQSPILMRRTVVDCIAYPLRLSGMGRGAARTLAAQKGAEVGLADSLNQPAHVLSGGERQKMALARALIRDPQVLFLDEPCANLDGRATLDIETILTEARNAGTTLIMSTHDIGQARRLADRVVFLHDGKLVEEARGASFFAAPKSAEAAAYLRGDLLT